VNVVVIQAFGVVAFVIGTIGLGAAIRRSADVRKARNVSRISHGLFWVALVIPGGVGLVHPGLSAYDRLLGMPGLPAPPVWRVPGAILLLVGLTLMVTSNRFLFQKGRGAAAFVLTRQLVIEGIYRRTRNPMSLGFYAACAGAGMVAGSLTVTLGVLLVLVPAHVANLKLFEERELELRYGEPYLDYKRRVPFLFPRLRG